MSGALVLFTRDLRVRDHPALSAAVREHEHVVPAFVLDDRLLATAAGSPNRVSFLLDCLRDLGESLAARGAALTVRRGEVAEQALELVRRLNLTAIHMSRDSGPYARARLQRLTAMCESERIDLRLFDGITAVPPGAIAPAGGDHYRVFTPYWRVWSGLTRTAPLPAPRRIRMPAGVPAPDPLPPPGAGVSPQLAAGGERAGRALLDRWLRGPVHDYGSGRDELAQEHTSRLSAHLHFGCVSPGEVLSRLPSGAGGESFARQICWRDFHHQVLAARPDMTRQDYRPRGDRWRRDERSADAWRAGMSGYPIVDAGMRQLAGEGFMHNRARMIVASFLTKQLYIDWRIGAAHFARLLADADVACNTGNWQWVAGTGNDTRPNRVLNPLRQAQRLDPDGDYVRRWVPELADLPRALIHQPWELPARELRALRYPSRPLWALAEGELRRGERGAPPR